MSKILFLAVALCLCVVYGTTLEVPSIDFYAHGRYLEATTTTKGTEDNFNYERNLVCEKGEDCDSFHKMCTPKRCDPSDVDAVSAAVCTCGVVACFEKNYCWERADTACQLVPALLPTCTASDDTAVAADCYCVDMERVAAGERNHLVPTLGATLTAATATQGQFCWTDFVVAEGEKLGACQESESDQLGAECRCGVDASPCDADKWCYASSAGAPAMCMAAEKVSACQRSDTGVLTTDQCLCGGNPCAKDQYCWVDSANLNYFGVCSATPKPAMCANFEGLLNNAECACERPFREADCAEGKACYPTGIGIDGKKIYECKEHAVCAKDTLLENSCSCTSLGSETDCGMGKYCGSVTGTCDTEPMPEMCARGDAAAAVLGADCRCAATSSTSECPTGNFCYTNGVCAKSPRATACTPSDTTKQPAECRCVDENQADTTSNQYCLLSRTVSDTPAYTDCTSSDTAPSKAACRCEQQAVVATVGQDNDAAIQFFFGNPAASCGAIAAQYCGSFMSVICPQTCRDVFTSVNIKGTLDAPQDYDAALGFLTSNKFSSCAQVKSNGGCDPMHSVSVMGAMGRQVCQLTCAGMNGINGNTCSAGKFCHASKFCSSAAKPTDVCTKDVEADKTCTCTFKKCRQCPSGARRRLLFTRAAEVPCCEEEKM